jgi:hypothetical protein
VRVGIVTYFFHPVLNPRAFRALELSKELSKQGHEVIVYVPDLNQDYSLLQSQYNFKVIQVEPGFYLNKKSRQQSLTPSSKPIGSDMQVAKQGLFKKIKTWLIQTFYPGGFSFEFAFTCSKILAKDSKPFDLIISVGLPISAHLAVARARRSNKSLCKTAVADYGDPYSFSKIINPPHFHRWLERRMLKKFDFILTPTEKGISSFLYFKEKSFIKVIPQGLDFSEVKLATEKKRDSEVNFVFAGNFYQDVRNPKELLDFLSKVRSEFKFTIFINTTDSTNAQLLEPYLDLLKSKLVVKPFLPRLDCIYEMSKADFLINISNTMEAHTPSKLIDYKLAGRPIFSYTPGAFKPEVATAFLNRNYEFDTASEIDLSTFDIRKIVADILALTPST